jgi:hypothetical protein
MGTRNVQSTPDTVLDRLAEQESVPAPAAPAAQLPAVPPATAPAPAAPAPAVPAK